MVFLLVLPEEVVVRVMKGKAVVMGSVKLSILVEHVIADAHSLAT